MEQSRKDFIKRLFDDAAPIWKVQIEKEFPKLFKEDNKVIGWYFSGNSKGFLHYFNGTKKAYGFSWIEKWSDNLTVSSIKKGCVAATDKEVEQALIKEAKKRGFKLGVNFKFIKGGVNYSGLRKIAKVGSTFKYENGILQTLGYGEWTIFNNGKWATIVETITKEQAEKELGKTILN